VAVGSRADLCLVDPDEEWIYDRHQTPSKASNNPFHGWPMKGRNRYTILEGKIVYQPS
jgi:dihydroorotase